MTSEEQDIGIVEETDFAETSNIPQKRTSLFKQDAVEDSTTAVSSDGVSNSEKAFGLMYCESMLGLLASVLPKELSVSNNSL